MLVAYRIRQKMFILLKNKPIKNKTKETGILLFNLHPI